MKLRDGYKKTEVGVIPDDWEVKKLSEIGEFKNGINKGKEYFGLGSPFVNLLDVFGVRKLLSNTVLGLVNSSVYERKFYDLKKGDVLFVRSSVKPTGVGLTTVIDDDLKNTVFSGFLIRYRDYGKLHLEYKAYCFYEEEFRKRIIDNSTVSANTNINQNALKKVQIALPPTLKEQTAIATALSDTDALISSLDKLIAKKRNIKQGAMQQLLTGKQRLAGFEGEWEVKKLGEISTLIGDGIHSTPQYVDSSEFYFINGNNLADNSIKITENTKCVSENEYRKHKKELNDKSILLSINGTIGNIAIFKNEKVILGKSAAFINLNKSLSINYIFYSLQAHSVKCYFEDELTGTTIRNLSLKSIRNTPLPIPSTLKEQQAIAQILTDMDAEIETLEKKRDKYKAIKQGMMQELLTGKTRLI